MRKRKTVASKKRLSTHPRKHKHKANRPFHGFDNTGEIDLIMLKGKLFQDVLGFTNERLTKLFANAVHLLQQHRYDDAIKACEVLTVTNPFVADFWLCLGMAEQANGATKRAREAFLMAQTLDPSRSEPYALAIDCCMDLDDPIQAQVIYNQAFKYAKKHWRVAESQLLLKELEMRHDAIEREVARIKAARI